MIIHNRARCLTCGDIIESTYRHDFRTCSCGNLSVDGGHDYLRRNFKTQLWADKSVTAEVHKDIPRQWYPHLIEGIQEMLEIDPSIANIRITNKHSITFDGGNPMRRDIIGDISDKMFADAIRATEPPSPR